MDVPETEWTVFTVSLNLDVVQLERPWNFPNVMYVLSQYNLMYACLI